MKKLLILVTAALWISCSSDTPIELQIKREIDKKSLGTTKIQQLEILEQLNDSTIKARHTFQNEFIDRQVRSTEIYYFTKDLDSIKASENLKLELYSSGKWIDSEL